MKYRNKRTGVIVEPAHETAERTFSESSEYEPVKEKRKRSEKLPDNAGSGP